MRSSLLPFNQNKLRIGGAFAHLFCLLIFRGAEECLTAFEARILNDDDAASRRRAFECDRAAGARDESAAVLRDDAWGELGIFPILLRIADIDLTDHVGLLWHVLCRPHPADRDSDYQQCSANHLDLHSRTLLEPRLYTATH